MRGRNLKTERVLCSSHPGCDGEYVFYQGKKRRKTHSYLADLITRCTEKPCHVRLDSEIITSTGSVLWHGFSASPSTLDGTHSVITTILQIIGKPFLECFFVYCGSNTPSTFSPFSVSMLRQLPLLPLGTTGHHTKCLVSTNLHSRELISLLLRLRCRACISPLLWPHSKHTCPFCSG